jgi:hypothetical protein
MMLPVTVELQPPALYVKLTLLTPAGREDGSSSRVAELTPGPASVPPLAGLVVMLTGPPVVQAVAGRLIVMEGVSATLTARLVVSTQPDGLV